MLLEQVYDMLGVKVLTQQRYKGFYLEKNSNNRTQNSPEIWNHDLRIASATA